MGMGNILHIENVFDTLIQNLAVFRRIPLATYRLQFNPAFTFRDAQQLVPYLYELGISDCYASPYMKARPGSLHGYDIVDHNALNPEIGAEEDYHGFVKELKAHEMGHILDMVPNHVGIAESSNPWWQDVLENGPSSRFASFFDIDWKPVKAELENKVLLPILGDQYGKVLENQELILTYEEGAFFVRYYQHKLPIAPRTSAVILKYRLDELERVLGNESPHFLEYQSILTALGYLPPRTEKDPEKIAERHREKEIIKKRLATLCDVAPEVRKFIEENVRIFNGVQGNPRSFDLLDDLLDAQAYRLAHWYVAGEEINYRRFFDINELAAIRMENPEVFRETHRLVFTWIREGKVTGLRIDHPDGLFDPAQYFLQLQKGCLVQWGGSFLAKDREPSEEAWETLERQIQERFDAERLKHPGSPLLRPFYLVAEKILSQGESLPEDWLVYGTVGYDFLNNLNGIFVDRAHEKIFQDIYTKFTGMRLHFQDLVYEKKKLIMQAAMASEINTLGHYLNRISEKNRRSRDFTLNSLTHAIREIVACFPVYRTYIRSEEGFVRERDRAYIEAAVEKAKRRNLAIGLSVFDFVKDILLLKDLENLEDQTCSERNRRDRNEQRDFVMRFQQLTGPVMARGLEDTALYIYNRLISLNEVGGHPQEFGISVAEFHKQNLKRHQRWPYSMLTTSTHDTKRSEDVRARINVLSELPQEWRACLTRWSRLNKKKKILLNGGQSVPDPNEEYLLYQTLLGVWPFQAMNASEYQAFQERIQTYMLKAIKEAKVNTSWINPNKDYDEAVQAFVRSILDDSKSNPFLDDFRPFQRKIAHYGIYNSLSQTLLKLTSPGVPDIYQGNEIWDFSLVDPDNRRPVDYARRRQMLKALRDRLLARTKAGPAGEADENLAKLARELTETWEDGRIKLYLTYRVLTYRRQRKELFMEGSYIPLEAVGSKKDHVCAFARKSRDQLIVVTAPRLLARLLRAPEELPLGTRVWGDSSLVIPDEKPGQRYHQVLSGEIVETLEADGKAVLPLALVFANFPVALLERRA